MDDKILTAEKEGYKSQTIMLESSFNSTGLWNILFWPGFLIDLGTQTMNKWDNTHIMISLDKEK